MKNLVQEENSLSFPSKIHKIRNLRDFRKLVERGRKIEFKFGFVRVCYNDMDVLRVAVSVSKKFSKKSVVRNRVKRIITEILRNKKHQLKSFDLWIHIKSFVEPELIKEDILVFTSSLRVRESDY
ncbi:MAG: ribonuclease P protein component [Spirochaetia bacterium]|nr:ribonuclease P protein component [Spirochaetota bacterium]MCX8097320.1 ribonuclease P protein component [Spirochaetota bacterium]MDW8112831.1 ribonuclease P protein component [Spirochaetia bacterium]